MNNSLLSRKSYVDRLFDDLFNFNSTIWIDPREIVSYGNAPRQSIKDGILTLSWDLPGVRKEDLKVEINDQIVSILAERFDTKSKMHRTYDVDDRYDISLAKAEISHGTLVISIPERKNRKPRQIEIEVK